MNRQNHDAIEMIEAFIEDPYSFALLWYTCDDLRLSYSLWAAEEILDRLDSNPDASPIDILEEFRDKMGVYMFWNTNTAHVFSVAYDTADYFIDLLM